LQYERQSIANWFVLKGKNLIQWPSSFSEDGDIGSLPD